jgi:hypothetical protein
MINSFLIGP